MDQNGKTSLESLGEALKKIKRRRSLFEHGRSIFFIKREIISYDTYDTSHINIKEKEISVIISASVYGYGAW